MLDVVSPALICLIFGIAVPFAAPAQRSEAELSQWNYYGGDPGGNRYADVRQINRDNVEHLEVAWTYRTGELGAGFARAGKLAFESTPILANGSLYLSTPTNIVMALDPESARERWRYDPQSPARLHYSEATSRGVSSWIDANLPIRGPLLRTGFSSAHSMRA